MASTTAEGSQSTLRELTLRGIIIGGLITLIFTCLLYTSDAADDSTEV